MPSAMKRPLDDDPRAGRGKLPAAKKARDMAVGASLKQCKAEMDELFGETDIHHKRACIDSSLESTAKEATEEEVSKFLDERACLNFTHHALPTRLQRCCSPSSLTDGITMENPSAPPPCLTFAGAPFAKPLVNMLVKQGFRTPSAVQACAWPAAMAGFDLLAVANTGSGKTLGYLLPALTRCHNASTQPANRGNPRCLVMAPTRELVLQITDEAAKYGSAVGCRTVAVYGGAPKWKQAEELKGGCDVVVATPGRLMDLQNLHGREVPSSSGRPSFPPATSLAQCGMLVLDEADR